MVIRPAWEKRCEMEQKTDKKPGGTAYLDMLRVAAIGAVILLHVVSGTKKEVPNELSRTIKTVYTIIVHICSIGVPLFLMISGALFLDNKKKTLLKDLFGKYILRLVLALIIFGTLFNVLELAYLTKSFSADYLVKGFVQVTEGVAWDHLWYIYMLIGIYLFMPMWQAAAGYLSGNLFRYLVVLLFLITCALPQIRHMGFRSGLQFPVTSVYVLYFLSGFYLHHYLRENSSLVPAALIIAAAFPVITVFDVIFEWKLTDGYNGIPGALAAASLFYLASRKKNVPTWCRYWRSLTFGIYLIHPLFLNLVYKGLHVTPAAFGGIILIPVFWVDTAFFSWLTVVILRKIPPVRKYVL